MGRKTSPIFWPDVLFGMLNLLCLVFAWANWSWVLTIFGSKCCFASYWAVCPAQLEMLWDNLSHQFCALSMLVESLSPSIVCITMGCHLGVAGTSMWKCERPTMMLFWLLGNPPKFAYCPSYIGECIWRTRLISSSCGPHLNCIWKLFVSGVVFLW